MVESKGKKHTKRSASRFNETPVNPIDAVIKKLDLVACEMEAKYGAGILPNLCTPETASKFMRINGELGDAIQAGDYDKVVVKTDSLIRGWKRMETEARDSGNLNQIEAWYVSDKGGIEYIVVKHERDSARMAALYPSRASAIYTFSDIAKMIESGSVVNCVVPETKLFSEIVKKQSWSEELLEDRVPF